jgi:hypothetical protein
MIGNCEKCPLPGYVASMERSRTAADIARSNVQASESPTQVEPYRLDLKQALDQLELAQKEYTEFVNIWGGVCGGKCKYGA